MERVSSKEVLMKMKTERTWKFIGHMIRKVVLENLILTGQAYCEQER